MLALLSGYKEKKTELMIFGGKDEDVDFIDVCLDCFDPAEKDIIVKTCIENVSMRSYARLTGISRQTLTKEKKRVLCRLLRYFRIRDEKSAL